MGHVLSVTQGPGFSLIPPPLPGIAASLQQVRLRSAVRKHEPCLIFAPVSVTLTKTSPRAVPPAATWDTGDAVQSRGHPTALCSPALLLNSSGRALAALWLMWPQGTCSPGHGELCSCWGGCRMFLPAHPWAMLWFSPSGALAACSAMLLFVCQQAPACAQAWT